MTIGTGDSRWNELLTLVPVDQIHLDTLIERSPAPGASEWMPIIEDVLGFLKQHSGNWVVTFPLGHCDQDPRHVSFDDPWPLADRTHLFEPLAVYAVSPGRVRLVTDFGDPRHRQRVRPDGIVESLSAQPPESDADDEPWTISLSFRIAH